MMRMRRSNFLLDAIYELAKRQPTGSPAIDNINHMNSSYGIMYTQLSIGEGKISLVNKTNK